MKIAACTIIAKNYLPFARVLMSSIRTASPDALRIVILVDRPDGFFDPAQEDFDVILSEALPIPNPKWFHFKYTIVEASTAVKPFALEYLFERYEVDQILYFDPDISVYSDLRAITEPLQHGSIILTPHLTAPLSDQHRPTDLDILRSGAYNLGFIGVNRGAETTRFLQWWKTRLYDQCVVDLAKGLFVDQRWIDLVPGMFGGVTIARNPGWNVAYWNLAHRTVARSVGGYAVNGELLSFFHFSGFNPDEPHGFSRHQDRFTLDNLGDARELVMEYRQRLYENGFVECRKWPYAFGTFRNGFPIPDVGRPAHHELPDDVVRISDPFSDEGYHAFVDLWNQPLTGPDGKPLAITRLGYQIYKTRSDAQQAMPDIFGSDLPRFREWLLSKGQAEHNLSDVLLAPISNAVKSWYQRSATDRSGQTHDSPVLHDKAIAALSGSGIRVSADQNANPVASLNVLIDNENATLHLTRLARAIYESRPDLHKLFPDPCGRDSAGFLLWFLTYGAHEYRLSEVLLSPLRSQWNAVVGSLENPLRRVWYRLTLQAITQSIKWRERKSKTRGEVSGRPRPGNGSQKASCGHPFGVNLIGYVRSEMGVGESVRCGVRAARASNIAAAIKSVDSKGPYRLDDRSIGEEDGEFPYAANIFHVNADQVEPVLGRLGPEFTRGKYNIGYWAWELEEFPDRWLSSFRFFDEIWTPSTFCQEAIARKSPIPVVRMPHAIQVECDRTGRSEFGLPDNRFVFLTIVDLLSIVERKNPFAVISAFRQAFGDARDCRLVVKINHGQVRQDQMAMIRTAAEGLPVTILDRTIDRSQINSLINSCDCLVSLHRSEGFGLTIAEAMYLNKPVVVTDYSGNTDFTHADNAFLVDCDLTRVPKGCDPYEEGAVWAEPRLDSAVAQMQTVRSSSELSALRAGRGADYIRRHLAPAVIGKLMRERLELAIRRGRKLV